MDGKETEELKATEEKIMKGIQWAYQPKQVKKSAKFIFKKNKFLNKSRAAIEKDINDCIKDGVKRNNKGEDCQFMSTGGWTILFSIEEGYGIIEVLVDANVSNSSDYDDYQIK